MYARRATANRRAAAITAGNRLPLVDATLVWTAVGSAAAVAGVAYAVVHDRRKASSGEEHVQVYLAGPSPLKAPPRDVE
jgi:branched-subunit amino acid ABC-type transport system permease component